MQEIASCGTFLPMTTNVEVSKNPNESTANLVRRFTKRLQGAGIVPKVRSGRYYDRIKSRNTDRKAKLRQLKRKETYDELLKMGKVAERAPRR